METEYKSRKWFRKLMSEQNYHSLTLGLDLTMLGIFIGIFSSLAINQISGDKFPILILISIGCNGIVVYCLVNLIRVRQDIDGLLETTVGKKGKFMDKWIAVAGYKLDERLRSFVIHYYLFLIAAFSGLLCVVINDNMDKKDTPIVINYRSSFDSLKNENEHLTIQLDSLFEKMRKMEKNTQMDTAKKKKANKP